MKTKQEFDELWDKICAHKRSFDIMQSLGAKSFGMMTHPSESLTHDQLREFFFEKAEETLRDYSK